MANTQAHSSSSSSSSSNNGPVETFPIEKLPKELRDAIWEEAFHLDQHKTFDPHPLATSCILNTRQPGGNPFPRRTKWLARGYPAPFFEYHHPPIAAVCPESREAAKRVCQRKEGMWLQPQETEVPIVTSIIDEEGERSLLPMLPSENYLVFELPTERDAKNLKALNRGIYDNPVLGRRFLELVVAAKDNQIKIKLPQHETFVMGSGINEPALPAEATKWVQRPQQARLISINDLDVWRELKGIASHCGYTWDLADRILKKQSRARMVNEALKPLQRLWECENKERLKAGQEALKPLPKIDVVLYLSMHYGGTVAMLGFRGAPNSQAYNDMISWGVL